MIYGFLVNKQKITKPDVHAGNNNRLYRWGIKHKLSDLLGTTADERVPLGEIPPPVHPQYREWGGIKGERRVDGGECTYHEWERERCGDRRVAGGHAMKGQRGVSDGGGA